LPRSAEEAALAALRLATSVASALALVGLGCATLFGDPVAEAWRSALIAKETGQLEEAARFAAEATAALPAGERTTERALNLLGEQARIALARERWEEAERFFGELRDRIQQQWPGSPALGYSLGELAKLSQRRGDLEGARKLWEELVALEPEGRPKRLEYRALALGGLAALARDAGRNDEADRLFRESITQGSTTSEPFWELRREYAAFLRERGREEEASRVEAAVGTKAALPRHYLFEVGGWRLGLDPFDERFARRWPDDRMPLRVHLPEPPGDAIPGASREAVRQAVVDAVESWSDAVRPGVPAFRFVESSWRADLRFRWTKQFRDLRLGETRAPTTETFRIRSIQLATQWDPRVAAPLGGLACVVRHEVGHALGLWGHSPEPGDLMFAAYFDFVHASRDGCRQTERDLETLRLLYGLEPGETILRIGVP
jgi:hypothetical protein